MADFKPVGGIDKPWIELDLNVDRIRRTAGRGTRNGLPGFRPYRWNPGERERAAWCAAFLAGVCARLEREYGGGEA